MVFRDEKLVGPVNNTEVVLPAVADIVRLESDPAMREVPDVPLVGELNVTDPAE